jgi:hypothetical protein
MDTTTTTTTTAAYATSREVLERFLASYWTTRARDNYRFIFARWLDWCHTHGPARHAVLPVRSSDDRHQPAPRGRHDLWSLPRLTARADGRTGVRT